MKGLAQFHFRRTVFDVPLLLFLISAAWGAWLAPNKVAGWGKFSLIVAGVALYYIIIQTPEWFQVRVGRNWVPFYWLLLLIPSATTVCFLLTNGPWGYLIQPNQAAGIIAAFLPLQIAALRVKKPLSVPMGVAVTLLSLSGLGLLVSRARGGWLVLLVAAIGWILYEVSDHLESRGYASPALYLRRSFWVIVLVVWGLVILVTLLATPLNAWLDGFDSGRLDLWRNSLALASDYPLSGLGLANFEMAYSSYVMMLHVSFLKHAHNLLLDVWLEQGVLGLVAVLWLFATAVLTKRTAESYWQRPALFSIAIILLHGAVDDGMYGYGGSGTLLLFVPFALLARPVANMSGSTPPPVKAPVGLSLRLARYLPALVLFALAALLLTIWQPTLQANLGALAQTRAELSIYRWPEWPIQDALRRSSEVDLTPALARYRTTLALDADNVTANRRMGQIELSWGEYEAARKHLETAYAAAPDQRATRQMLGEVYALAGEVERAVPLWETLDLGQQQLDIRRWWYEYIGEPQGAARIADAAEKSRMRQPHVTLLKP
jgi:O-antigen ligase